MVSSVKKFPLDLSELISKKSYNGCVDWTYWLSHMQAGQEFNLIDQFDDIPKKRLYFFYRYPYDFLYI